jgi:hypothetical protein
MRIAESWAQLPPHIREAIQTLIDATSIDRKCSSGPRDSEWDAETIAEAAWGMARRCRSVVQACLREEEWRDADQEFRAIIEKGLRSLGPGSKRSLDL